MLRSTCCPCLQQWTAKSSCTACGVLAFALMASFFCNQNLDAQELNRHLDSGEFSRAEQIALEGHDASRAKMLAQLSSARRSAGEYVAALRTPGSASSLESKNSSLLPVDDGAAGGGSFADFSSLMQLIETTVVPDTWEALGGPSAMSPYPQGVYVDPAGTLQNCTDVAKSDSLADLASLLKRPGAADQSQSVGDWRSESPLRVVSLRRLRDELLRHRFFGQAMPESMLFLAGLSRVQYIALSDDDILLAGPVGGIAQVDGWFRDRQSGLNTLRSDFFLTCLAASLRGQPFGCTIDPTPEGMKAAAAVAQGIQSDRVPVGQAAKKMEEALGLQRVEVFGTAGNTPLGYVIVEADRHMKQLALGQVEMPAGVKNYLDVIDEFIVQGPPNQLLLRLWFTASARSIRADAKRSVFEIAGSPIQLSGQNQRALAGGGRGAVMVDARSDAFVAEFNKHWGDIRAKYPIYSALESIYRTASIAELANRFATNPSHIAMLDSLAAESSGTDWDLPTPKQVASIAVHHRVSHGRKVHHVVLASGGVSVNAKQTIQTKITDYPTLSSINATVNNKPKLVQRWWWDTQ